MTSLEKSCLSYPINAHLVSDYVDVAEVWSLGCCSRTMAQIFRKAALTEPYAKRYLDRLGLRTVTEGAPSARNQLLVLLRAYAGLWRYVAGQFNAFERKQEIDRRFDVLATTVNALYGQLSASAYPALRLALQTQPHVSSASMLNALELAPEATPLRIFVPFLTIGKVDISAEMMCQLLKRQSTNDDCEAMIEILTQGKHRATVNHWGVCFSVCVALNDVSDLKVVTRYFEALRGAGASSTKLLFMSLQASRHAPTIAPLCLKWGARMEATWATHPFFEPAGRPNDFLHYSDSEDYSDGEWEEPPVSAINTLDHTFGELSTTMDNVLNAWLSRYTEDSPASIFETYDLDLYKRLTQAGAQPTSGQLQQALEQEAPFEVLQQLITDGAKPNEACYVTALALPENEKKQRILMLLAKRI